MIIYTTPGAFSLGMASAKTAQAKTRPATFSGRRINESDPEGTIGTVKHTLTDSEFAAWSAEADAEKRAAILAASNRRTITTGKVQVKTDALNSWVARLRAENDERNAAAVAALPEGERKSFVPTTPAQYAASVLASGIVVLDNADEDDTAEVLSGLFG